MDILEKAEVLKEKANISYEEAKRVLEETNGDLLDAMVILERQGKISRPETEMIMRDAAAAGQEEESGKDEEAGKAAPESAKSSKSCGRKFTKTLEKLIHVMKDNFFHVSRKGKDLFMMPVWVFALILLFAWKMVIPVIRVCGAVDPSQGPWEPGALRAALSLGGQATAGGALH